MNDTDNDGQCQPFLITYPDVTATIADACPKAIRTFGAVKSFDDPTDSGSCYPSHEAIADRAGVSVRTVISDLQKLRDAGVIDWTNGQNSNTYRFPRPESTLQRGKTAENEESSPEKLRKAEKECEESCRATLQSGENAKPPTSGNENGAESEIRDSEDCTQSDHVPDQTEKNRSTTSSAGQNQAAKSGADVAPAVSSATSLLAKKDERLQRLEKKRTVSGLIDDLQQKHLKESDSFDATHVADVVDRKLSDAYVKKDGELWTVTGTHVQKPLALIQDLWPGAVRAIRDDEIEAFLAAEEAGAKAKAKERGERHIPPSNPTEDAFEPLPQDTMTGETADGETNGQRDSETADNRVGERGKSDVPCEKILQDWNNFASAHYLPEQGKLTGAEKTMLRKRWYEWEELNPDADGWAMWEEIKEAIHHSSYCLGDNEDGWQIDLKWLICDDTKWLRLVEGQFQDREPAAV